MAVSVASPGKLNPEVQLAQAISEYEAILSSDDKAVLRNWKAKTRPDAIDVFRFTAEIDRSSHINRKCVGTRFTNVLQAIQTFASIGDVIIGGSQNLIASGLWTLVRFTVQVATNHVSFLEKFSHLFMEIGRSAPRYQNLALVYPRSSDLQSSVCEYFTVLVQLCTKAVQFARRKALNRLLVTSLRSFESEFGEFLQKLASIGKTIKGEVMYLSAKTQQDEIRENSRFRSRVLNKLDKSYEPRRSLAFKLSILDRCSVYDYATSWRQARKKGTYSISDSAEYLKWKNSGDRNTALVCIGKLGSGKTVLAANLVEDLILNVPKGKVGYFFCRYDVAESLKARTLIGSLVRQLVELIDVGDLMDSMTRFSRESTQSFSLDELVSLFNQFMAENSRESTLYIVIDGLDDCEGEEKKLIFTYLTELAQEVAIQYCFMTRSDLEPTSALINSHFAEQYRFPITDQTNEINDYINEELERRLESGALCLSEPETIVEIRNSLAANAQGMFLWVVLQIESICDEETDDAILAALKELPTELPAVYDRILRKSSRVKFMEKILKLVSSAYRPLTLLELREALSVTPGDKTLDRKKFVNDIHRTISSCGSLLELSEDDMTVHFIHPSAKQHLLLPNMEGTDDSTTRFSIVEANRLMGGICVTYLSWEGFETQLTRSPRAWTIGGSETVSAAVNFPLQSTSVAQKVAQLYLRKIRRSESSDASSFDFKQALMEAHSGSNKEESPLEFHFLSYAKKYWIDHGRDIDPDMVLIWPLWSNLILQRPSIIDRYPWDKIYPMSTKPHVSFVQWALANCHPTVFFIALKTDRSLCLGIVEGQEDFALKYQVMGKWDVAATLRRDIVESLAMAYSDAPLDVLRGMWNLALTYEAMEGMTDKVEVLLKDFILKLGRDNSPFVDSVVDSSTAFQKCRNNSRSTLAARWLLASAHSMSVKLLGRYDINTLRLLHDISHFDERFAKNLAL